MNRVIVVTAVTVLLLMGCGTRRARSPAVAPPQEQVPAQEQAAPQSSPRVADAGRRWTFSDGTLAALPAGFRALEGDWLIAPRGARGDSGKSPQSGLLQQARNANPVFNLVLIDDTSYADLEISVLVQALDGALDQGGGPVWRVQDERNYYIARWNPLEDNYRVYKVVDGVRLQLGSAQTKPGSASRLLLIRMRGSHIECSLDGEALLRVEDTTFPKAGQIGLWTKADARTLFMNLRAVAIASPATDQAGASPAPAR